MQFSSLLQSNALGVWSWRLLFNLGGAPTSINMLCLSPSAVVFPILSFGSFIGKYCGCSFIGHMVVLLICQSHMLGISLGTCCDPEPFAINRPAESTRSVALRSSTSKSKCSPCLFSSSYCSISPMEEGKGEGAYLKGKIGAELSWQAFSIVSLGNLVCWRPDTLGGSRLLWSVRNEWAQADVEALEAPNAPHSVTCSKKATAALIDRRWPLTFFPIWVLPC